MNSQASVLIPHQLAVGWFDWRFVLDPLLLNVITRARAVVIGVTVGERGLAMKTFGVTLLILVMTSSFSWGQTKKPRTLDELAAYTGADRQQILLDRAKAEGKIVWYTSLSGVYRELVDAFKRKYPDISVEVYRGVA
jgi:hypothetical protein